MARGNTLNEEEIAHFTFSNRYYLTGPFRFIAGIFMVWWPNSKHYTLTNQRIKIRVGVLSRKTDEIELYRIKDVEYKASFFERIWSIGNIKIISTQKTDTHPTMRAIRNAEQIRELIRDSVQASRRRTGVREVDYFQDSGGFADANLIDQ
jgi:uncharacterized membrane protein YdbT with pleckstrin-like domain